MSSTLEALSWPLPSPGPNVSGADPRWTKNTKPCSELTNVERCRTRGDLNACEHNFGCNVSLNGEQPSASFNLVRSHEIDTPDKLRTARHKLRMRKTLTARQCETLSCPPTRRRIDYRDTVVPGLCLRVTATARKTFTLRTRVKRRQVRYAIGGYPLISLAQAREQGRKILRDVQLGRYERAEEQKTLTLGDAVAEFIAKHVMVKNRDRNATPGCLKRFEPLYDMPLADIKRAHVIRIVDAIMAERKPYRANRALAAIKKLFAWSRDRGYIEHHPIDRLKPPGKEIARDRILADRELAALWEVAEKIDYPFGPAIQLLILTAQRRGEVTTMRWSDLDFERAMWTIPAAVAKNGRVHEVPLSEPVLDILRALPRFVGSDLLFTTTGTRAP